MGGNTAQVVGAGDHLVEFDRDARPDVSRPRKGLAQAGEPRTTLGENLKLMLLSGRHHREHLCNELIGHRRMEQIAHAVDEDAARSSDETRAILEPLRRSGRARLDALVDAAAKALYKSELARGGAHLDLGLLGARIFVPAVRSALDAGRDRLWEIREITPPSDAAPAR